MGRVFIEVHAFDEKIKKCPMIIRRDAIWFDLILHESGIEEKR
jgi:hypothetical protein